MLKAKAVEAVSISLNDGAAVFVAHGEEWNMLREFRCVSPEKYSGQSIITAPEPGSVGGMRSAFTAIFRGLPDDRSIVMASPDLSAAINATVQEGEK